MADRVRRFLDRLDRIGMHGDTIRLLLTLLVCMLLWIVATRIQVAIDTSQENQRIMCAAFDGNAAVAAECVSAEGS